MTPTRTRRPNSYGYAATTPETKGIAVSALDSVEATPQTRNPRPAYPLSSLSATLDQTAAVVEGTATSIAYSYDETNGPRTNVTLSNLHTHLGSVPGTPSSIVLRSYGGPVPDGTSYQASELARFALSGRYLVFLANHDWRWSPVLGGLAFRIETVRGKEILVDTDGLGVTSLDAKHLRRRSMAVATGTGLDHSDPFKLTALRPIDDSELSLFMSKDDFLQAVSGPTAAGAPAATRFDGSFLFDPTPMAGATSWRSGSFGPAATATAAGPVIDAGTP